MNEIIWMSGSEHSGKEGRHYHWLHANKFVLQKDVEIVICGISIVIMQCIGIVKKVVVCC